LLVGCGRFATDTELDGVRKEQRKLKDGYRGGQGPKTGRSNIQEEKTKMEAICALSTGKN
jgi:hypothetical protein